MCFDCGCCEAERYSKRCERCPDKHDCEIYLEHGEEYAREYDNFDDPMFEDIMTRCDFRDPGGRSALRNGPRIHPCPTCGEPNRLSAADKAHGYQCDSCADRLERGGY